MNVLSLFDGMSCGQLALQKANIEVSQYYASEIEKASIEVTQHNFPCTLQLGDVRNIKAIDLPRIDLLIGGSPCTDLSISGKMTGMSTEDGIEIDSLESYLEATKENVQFVGQSYLFWEYLRLLRELKPKYFLLENVKMKQRWIDFISKQLNTIPHFINSRYLTAQDRKRLYWTNITFEGIEDNNIILLDILDSNVDKSLYLRDDVANRYTPTLNYNFNRDKSCVVGKLSPYQGDRVFDVNAKARSLSASGGNNGGGGCNIIFDPSTNKLRKLSVNECERLQSVPINYTHKAATTQRYKMLGNGWTVDVIAHILKGINI